MRLLWVILSALFLISGVAFPQDPQPEKVLTQFERDYVLLKGRQFEFEENLTYTYYSANQIFLKSFAILDPVFLTFGQFGIKSAKRNIFVNTFMFRYGITNNLQVEMSVPLVYRYDMIGITTGSEDRHMERSGLGDIAFGMSVQPAKETAIKPAVVFTLGLKTKTGKGPFDVDTEKDVPTGTGYYAVRVGMNMIKGIDPVVVFGSLGFIYSIEEKVEKKVKSEILKSQEQFIRKVYPGDTISFNLGMAYALSYTFSISAQYIQNYTLFTYIDDGTGKKRVPNSILNSAMFKFGAGLAASPRTSVSFAIYMGLTDDAPDYMIELRVPVKF